MQKGKKAKNPTTKKNPNTFIGLYTREIALKYSIIAIAPSTIPLICITKLPLITIHKTKGTPINPVNVRTSI